MGEIDKKEFEKKIKLFTKAFLVKRIKELEKENQDLKELLQNSNG